MRPIPEEHPLRLLFAGMVEHAFYTEVGMCDPRLTTYLADLLVAFTHVERFEAIRNAQGKRLEQIASMLIALSDDLPTSREERDRMLYRHIGDYTLFWAGVYPEQLRRSPASSDLLIAYVDRGKRSYAIASELGGEDAAPPSSLFRHLSEDFESCLYGLGLVRKTLEHDQNDPTQSGGDLVL